ncbi:Protein detoxification 45, chloroplastic [Vitis vinifera]|uniref:Protein detoxification 45, chloroplastic n=1 Tax=Vitis vinifera TaxID=29760 RepID=A0A438CGV3_VITVI|nr:Protein detoxification 45, chloroplastic [Vitis vinifera]
MVDERLASKRRCSSEGILEVSGTSTSESRPLIELIKLSVPAIAGQAIEPLAQLMETAYIGRLGPLELASAGVAISIFNIISKVFNIPLLSIATSFVAEDVSRNASKESTSEVKKLLPSVSTALVLAVGIGVFEAAALYLGSGLFLNTNGHIIRIGNLSAIFFFPTLIYYFRLGVAGAAISTVASQYIVTFLMIWYLNKRTVLRIPNLKNLHLGGYLRSGGFLLGRTLASVMTITFSTSMAARQGPLAMAAHQICLQVWLSVSLLADALAGSAQTGLFTGISLAVILGVSFGSLATLFTKDAEVLDIVRSGLLFVSASQPVNALAYVFDGLHYGVSDFLYAAGSMMVVERFLLHFCFMLLLSLASQECVGFDSFHGLAHCGWIFEHSSVLQSSISGSALYVIDP